VDLKQNKKGDKMVKKNQQIPEAIHDFIQREVIACPAIPSENYLSSMMYRVYNFIAQNNQRG